MIYSKDDKLFGNHFQTYRIKLLFVYDKPVLRQRAISQRKYRRYIEHLFSRHQTTTLVRELLQYVLFQLILNVVSDKNLISQ